MISKRNNENIYRGSFSFKKEYFVDKKWANLSKAKLFVQNGKHFIVQMQSDQKKERIILWICLFGSKIQANDLNYKVEIEVPRNKVLYEGPVRYIDENKSDIVKSQVGLNVPFSIVKKCLKQCRLHFSIEIKNLKFNYETNQAFESENYDMNEPLKMKIENNE